MRHCAFTALFGSRRGRRLVQLALVALLILLPLPAFAQEERAAEKAATEKVRQDTAAKPQASPDAAKTDDSKKPEDEKAEEDKKPADPMSSPTFNGLKLRSIGPAFTSGRVSGFAVDPNNPARYFVAAASGGVWKTINNGTTWTPVFDKEGSYSIGAIALDPKNPLTVWVGTGENNSQRSVSYGNGVYRSDDGGKTWKNVGLKTSEHIGRIALDPRDSNTVYVAAQGPLWGPGGDRGLYKTTDSGKTWKKILSISDNTGVTDVVIDPQNPETLYAAAYQRRRHMWTLINGGPESALYKSTDAGATWNKLKAGLPTTDLGRIGLAISPVDSNVIYATVEAADKKGGIFRSNDRGGSWERRNEYDVTAMYYSRIVADPKNVDRVYVMNVFLLVSDDGGKTLRRLGEKSKHVDNHDIWIDPNNNDHYLVGCDGGVYESNDRGANWEFKRNLPITQFYDVTTDNASPVLQRLRRRAGQLQRWWPIAHAQRFRHYERRLVCYQWRRRFSQPGRSGRPEHHLCRTSERLARALRQTHRRTHGHSTAGWSRRRTAADGIGIRLSSSVRTRTRVFTSPPTNYSAAMIAATAGKSSAANSRAASIATSCR